MRKFFFWAFVLLALPGCGDILGIEDWDPQASQADPPENLIRGDTPRSGVVFCDIEKARRCPINDDLALGIPLTAAAVELNAGKQYPHALDYSPASLSKCGGQPEVVVFEGPFPQGIPECVNCATIPQNYADADALCRVACWDYDVTNDGNPKKPPTTDRVTYCTTAARASVNAFVPATNPLGCFKDSCTDIGSLLASFTDPRREPTIVKWIDLFSTTANGGDLTRSADSTGEWDAGGTSEQRIESGDAFLEFGISKNVRAGLSTIPIGCAEPCHDEDPSLADIAVAFDAGGDGHLYIFENNLKVVGPDVNGSFTPYADGDRFRIYLVDNHDGTATVSYSKVIGSCTPGLFCNTQPLHTSALTVKYPVRVDASIEDKDSKVADARLMYIQ